MSSISTMSNPNHAPIVSVTDDQPTSTLLTIDNATPPSNCLAAAASTARTDADEIVFLGPVAETVSAGHVVLRDMSSGGVREPDAGFDEIETLSVDDYAERHGLTVLCAVPAATIHRLLAMNPSQRAAALPQLGAPLASLGHFAFGGVAPVGGQAQSSPSVEDKDVHSWLDALGNSVTEDDKKGLAQTGDDAATLKSWFDSHKRGDPAINTMPQNVSDAENRLFANDAVAKQLTDKGVVTRDKIGDFLHRLDDAAKSAKSDFESFEKHSTNLDPSATSQAALTSVLQANLPILDDAGSSNAKVDGKINADDLKAIESDDKDSKAPGLPDVLKNAAIQYSLDPGKFSSLANAGGASKDGTISNSNFEALLSGKVGFSAQNSHVHDWLNSLGGAVSDSDKASLAQIGDDAATLQNWFGAHDRGDPKINDMPKNVADAESRLMSNDAVAKRLTVDGTITRDAIGGFVSDLNKSADSAKNSFAAFKEDDPKADAIATEKAVNGSILEANMPVLDAAGSGAAKVDNKFNADDLKAVASGDSDSKLPDALKHAAAFFGNAGEFTALGNAGLDASTLSDGTIQNSNLDALIGKSGSKTEDDSISSLKSDAMQQAVKDAGGDASKLNPDYFTGASSSASGADKAAALIQLSQTIGRYNAGENQFQTDKGPNVLDSPDQYHNYYDGPTPGETRSDFIKDVQSRIDTLSKDTDVQSFMTDKMPAALQGLVSSDPSLKAAMQKQSDADSSTQALQDAFAQKDSNGNPLSTTAALGSFLAKPSFYAQALNTTTDLSKALAAAPQDIKDKITQGYDDITSGKQIDDLIASGTPSDKAIIQSATDKTVYDSVLDADTVQAGTDKFNDKATSLARAQLTDGKSGEDMLNGLGVTGVDDPKLQQLVQNNLGTLATAGKDQPPAAEIIAAIRQINDAMRSGLKFDDAMAKVQKGWTPVASSSTTTPAYKAGVFHGASALLLAGAMGARLGTGGGSDLQTANQSLGVAGLLTEGGAKYYGTTLKGLQDVVKNDAPNLKNLQALSELPGFTPEQQAQLAEYQGRADNLKTLTTVGKDAENVGKSIGGVAGNALGLALGAIGAKQAADAGDIGGAAAQGIFAGLNGISSIAGIGEVATYVLPRVGALAATESLAALGGVFGAIGGVVGGVAAIGGLIYAIVKSIQADDKKAQQEGDWYKELQDGFKPSGITVPDLGTLIAAPNGYVPDSPPPVTY
ncbi:type III effector HrpK domain-containing protein [Lichenihabitans psoromatis]|uniref:type III effector HrpK domain-containing protein n=1 Tax=Lichenihabitans psoromatis TaxID=2528642 RepID=UPI0013F176B8|nr:type III effector HrpK domain-containing protein [Lichenihabitans psoromatis]